jgi:hypothetical protein
MMHRRQDARPAMRPSLVLMAALILQGLAAGTAAGAGGFDSSFPNIADLLNRAVLGPVTSGDFFRTTAADGLPAGGCDLSLSGTVYDSEMAGLPGSPGNKDLHATITAAWGYDDRLSLGAALPYILRNGEGAGSNLLDLMLFGRYRLAGERAQGMRWAGELLLVLPTGPGGTPDNLYSLETAAARMRILGTLRSGDWDLGGNLGFQSYSRVSSGGVEWTLLGGGYLAHILSPDWTLMGEYSLAHHQGGSFHPGIDTILLGARWTASPGVIIQGALGAGILRPEETWRVTGGLVYSWGGTAAPAAASSPSVPASAAGPPAFAQPLAPSGAAPALSPSDTPRPLPQVAAPPPVVEGTAGTAPAAILPPAPPSPVVAAPQLRIEVANRSGLAGAGHRFAAFLGLQGYPVAFVDDSPLYVRDTTFIYYAEGMENKAVEIGRKIRKEQEVERSPFPLSEIEILILVGTDLAE